MSEMKTYKFIYEVEALEMTGRIEEVATVSPEIVVIVKTLAEENEMINLISIEEVKDKPSNDGIFASLIALLKR